MVFLDFISLVEVLVQLQGFVFCADCEEESDFVRGFLLCFFLVTSPRTVWHVHISNVACSKVLKFAIDTVKNVLIVLGVPFA